VIFAGNSTDGSSIWAGAFAQGNSFYVTTVNKNVVVSGPKFVANLTGTSNKLIGFQKFGDYYFLASTNQMVVANSTYVKSMAIDQVDKIITVVSSGKLHVFTLYAFADLHWFVIDSNLNYTENIISLATSDFIFEIAMVTDEKGNMYVNNLNIFRLFF
jgi:hypothetical protein